MAIYAEVIVEAVLARLQDKLPARIVAVAVEPRYDAVDVLAAMVVPRKWYDVRKEFSLEFPNIQVYPASGSFPVGDDRTDQGPDGDYRIVIDAYTIGQSEEAAEKAGRAYARAIVDVLWEYYLAGVVHALLGFDVQYADAIGTTGGSRIGGARVTVTYRAIEIATAVA